ncbi:hypothetical protein IFR05_002785 [Cadophora sp. M221]|nr:hypothetical protein IFR05_002785 [Cadophora sp. M221]
MAINKSDLALDDRVQDEFQKAMNDYERTAAEGGELLVKELIETGEVHEDFQKMQKFMLWIAARGGHKTMVKLLLGSEKVNVKAGYKPLWYNRLRYKSCRPTPLLEAARMGYIAVVELLLQEKGKRLLQEKVDVNAADIRIYNYRTALQAAAGGGHLAVVHRLLQEKAEVNAPPAISVGRTALQAAAEGGYLAVVDRLLQENADVNAAAG